MAENQILTAVVEFSMQFGFKRAPISSPSEMFKNDHCWPGEAVKSGLTKNYTIKMMDLNGFEKYENVSFHAQARSQNCFEW